MDQKILALATEKTADRLQEFLQTVKEDDVSTGKQVVLKADVTHDDKFKVHVRKIILPPLLSLGGKDLFGNTSH